MRMPENQNDRCASVSPLTNYHLVTTRSHQSQQVYYGHEYLVYYYVLLTYMYVYYSFSPPNSPGHRTRQPLLRLA